MAVDLIVTQNKNVPVTYEEEWSLHFDDDGYYWYLYPLFEDLYTATENMIDLYGDARFERHHFSHLRRMLAEVRRKIEQQPAIWSVFVAMQVKPEMREIWKSVKKDELKAKLAQLEKMIDYAEATNEDIVCMGD